ncbi:ThrE exporter family protein [Pleurotus pulmonarius]
MNNDGGTSRDSPDALPNPFEQYVDTSPGVQQPNSLGVYVQGPGTEPANRPLSRIDEERKTPVTEVAPDLAAPSDTTLAAVPGEEPKDQAATDKATDGATTAPSRPKAGRLASVASLRPIRSLLMHRRRSSAVARNIEDVNIRRTFILKLAKALLHYGAPSHRIESQLQSASEILDAQAEFVHLPNILIVTIRNGETKSSRTHFVRARGRVALSSLHKVHLIYRDVLHDTITAAEGTAALRELLRRPPIYPLAARCFLAFLCASIICVLSFGGSIIDMWISGLCASLLQYLGLTAANKSAMYANVYEISVSIVVAFVARGLSSINGNLFCYSAISSAGIVVILPGFTILISALELMSKNIFCGSVRVVYAIIYTLFLGFGLTIGSDFYLLVDRRARRGGNTSQVIGGVLGIGEMLEQDHVFKGCYRDGSWPWYRQPFPWWTMLFLVPLYSICSSLSNLQSYRSIQLPVMVIFSCCSYTANKAAALAVPGRTDLSSAAGAFAIGVLGNLYSRIIGGTAFTSMVTGVLFLVPSAIAQGGGLAQNFHSSAEQYYSGFTLALRMISVASGVTIGLFVSQVLVYTLGRRKNVAHFAF